MAGCLLLTECLIVSAASLSQTSPAYTPLCPNDRLVLTCVADGTGNAYWRNDSTGIAILLNDEIKSTVTDNGTLILNVTDIMGNTVTSTGTILSVHVSMNGSMISCTASLATGSDTFTIKITGKHLSFCYTYNYTTA